mgnify:FL=1
MSCAYPSYDNSIRDLHGNLIPIPCGRCFCCRLDLQKRIIDRLYCAWHSHTTSAFVTFTYDDEHLVIKDGYYSPTLVKSHVSDYIDKIKHRKNIPDFEYFICGEYGDSFNRPHYHALFFGLDYQLYLKFFVNSWKMGSVKVLPLSPKSFRYVSKYVVKTSPDDDALYFDKGIIPPFRKMSRGLGSKQFYLHKDEIQRDGFFFLNSRKIYVNRYFFNKLVLFNDSILTSKDAQLNDAMRSLSEQSFRFDLSPVPYNLLRISNLEKQLSNQQLNKKSHF